MIKNYVKIAWRNIKLYKTYSILNILGLALGLCACTVIYVIVQHEMSFDSFHPGAERIYRVMGDLREKSGNVNRFAKLPSGLSAYGTKELSGIEAIAGVIPFQTQVTVAAVGAEKKFNSRAAVSGFNSVAFAEEAWFAVFKYQWLSGNAKGALTQPATVVLTDERARQYFGDVPADQMVGRKLIYEDSLVVTVSGVVKSWESNTDLGFTDLISFSTIDHSFLRSQLETDGWSRPFMNMWTFVKRTERSRPELISAQLNGIIKRHGDPQTELSLWLQPISKIHFDGNIIEYGVRTADKSTLYGLSGIAIFILILALVNFINLATAQAIRRAKEVGIRKVLGGRRWQLVTQFLIETFSLTLFAAALGLALVRPAFRFFHAYIPPDIDADFFKPDFLSFLVGIVILSSILAGFYPAWVLSSYSPATNIHKAKTTKFGQAWFLRRGLVVFQFAVSLIFIFSALIIALQLKYTREKDLGFKADAIILLNTPPDEDLAKTAGAADRIRQLSGVTNVAQQWVPPMVQNGRGRSIKLNKSDTKETDVVQIACNEGFIPLYQIKILAGRNLEASDSIREFVINENLSKLMGCKTPSDAIGRMLYWDDKPYPVVGVVGDFHSRSFHEQIAPAVFLNRPDRERTVAVKLNTNGEKAGTFKSEMAQIEKAWKAFFPNSAFDYQFYDETLKTLYEKDEQTAALINAAMAIAIFISCLGLFALSLFTAEIKAKEIAIRKILGAGISNITYMLSRDFIALVIIAAIIAAPAAWFFMNEWLQGFAYRMAISWWIFLFGGLIAILIAMLTTSFHAIRAATLNPIRNLRTE